MKLLSVILLLVLTAAETVVVISPDTGKPVVCTTIGQTTICA